MLCMLKVSRWCISANREPIINHKKLCPYLCLFLALVGALSLGCGKKVDEENPVVPQRPNPQVDDIELELSKQELLCAGADRTNPDNSCPSYLTKVVVLHKDKLKFCTGFLTKDDVVVTASSCLPEKLRFKNVPCDKDVFFFFEEDNQKPTRIGCKNIQEVSHLEGKEPFLWRNDIAYIQMDKKIKRRSVTILRNGMNDMDPQLSIWSIDQIDAYQGVIHKSNECKPIHNSYFNPLATNQSSPVMTVAGCKFSNGNSGSPIVDLRGKVRGIVSKPVDQAEIDEVVAMRILERDRDLKPMIHATNFACAPLFPDQDVLSETECNKRLEISLYDLGQREMINETTLFKPLIQKIEHSLNEKNRYLKMAIELTDASEGYNVVVYPKCFKNVSKWIGEFNNNKPFTFNNEIPELKIEKKMNEFGIIFAKEVGKVFIPTNFQFKPSILRSSKKATVFMWAKGPTRTFENLPETCESLL